MQLNDLLRWQAQATITDEKEKRHEKVRVYRKGKTYRDHHAGRPAQNEANKAARREWNNTSTGKRSLGNFPWSTCNGKRNRQVYTGKDGQRVCLDIQIPSSMR